MKGRENGLKMQNDEKKSKTPSWNRAGTVKNGTPKRGDTSNITDGKNIKKKQSEQTPGRVYTTEKGGRDRKNKSNLRNAIANTNNTHEKEMKGT